MSIARPRFLNELVTFHSIDRQLFARLVGDLGFNEFASLKIIAFWNWLESCGYSDIVFRLLKRPNSLLHILNDVEVQGERVKRVVLRNREEIGKIFESERVVHLRIYGKLGWARRFVTMAEAMQYTNQEQEISCSSDQVHNFFNASTLSFDELSLSSTSSKHHH